MRARTVIVLILIMIFLWGSISFVIVSALKTIPPPSPSLKVYSEKNLSFKRLEERLLSITESAEGTCGVYLEDLKTGQSLEIQESEKFYGASLYKVPLLVAFYQKVEKEEINPKEEIEYLKEDFEGGDGSIQNDPLGTKYTILEVVRRMIKESDNVGKNMILRRAGSENVSKVIRLTGASEEFASENIVCPKDAALIFRGIYKNEFTSKKHSLEMLNLLENTSFEERIPKVLPENVKVAHKIGTWPETGSYHDCGIILSKNPYILCILTKDTSYEGALSLTQQISKEVFLTLTRSDLVP